MSIIISCADNERGLGEGVAVYESSNSNRPLEYGFCKEAYDQVNMELKRWVEDSLSIAKYYGSNEWMLDSLMFFDDQFQNAVGQILLKMHEMREADAMDYYFARKVENRWKVILINDSYTMSRRKFQYDAYLPMSFEKLAYISQRGLIKKSLTTEEFSKLSNSKVEYYINGYADYHCKNISNKSRCLDSLLTAYSLKKQKINFDSLNTLVIDFHANKVKKPSLQRKPRKVPWYERLYKRREQRMVLEETDWKSQKIKWIVIDSCK